MHFPALKNKSILSVLLELLALLWLTIMHKNSIHVYRKALKTFIRTRLWFMNVSFSANVPRIISISFFALTYQESDDKDLFPSSWICIFVRCRKWSCQDSKAFLSWLFEFPHRCWSKSTTVAMKRAIWITTFAWTRSTGFLLSRRVQNDW